MAFAGEFSVSQNLTAVSQDLSETDAEEYPIATATKVTAPIKNLRRISLRFILSFSDVHMHLAT
jgi:hypothetical protein